MWTAVDDANINVNHIQIILEKLNELKWNEFLERKDFHWKDINQNVFK